MAIVYRHRRLDNNEVFYVGIGNTIKRAFDKNKRSAWWKRIYEKHSHIVEIIQEDISWEDAKELEILLILLYGRMDLKTGNLVNMTDGGDGCIGRKVTEEQKAKISKANKNFSKETRLKISLANKGKITSEETKLKIGIKNKGKVRTQEQKEKISESLKGNTRSLGHKHTESTKLKMSNSSKGKAKTKEHNEKVSTSKLKPILDTSNGVFYYGIEDVCSLYGFNYWNLASQLNGKLKNKTNFIYA